MITRTLFLTFLIAGIAAGQDFRMPPAQTGGRLPANDALSASVAAHGGEPLLQILTIRLFGTSTNRNGASQPLTVSSSLDGSTRLDYGRPATRSLITTLNGRHEVVEGAVKGRPGHSGLYGQLDLFGIFAARSKSGVGKDRGVIGPGEMSGRTTLRIRAGTDHQKTFYGRPIDDELDIEFDHLTGLIAAIHRTGYADESLDLKFVSTYTFSDYRKILGQMWLPFHITRHLDGQLVETIAVDSYQINPSLATDLFRR
jgi:hypothetical protein